MIIDLFPQYITGSIRLLLITNTIEHVKTRANHTAVLRAGTAAGMNNYRYKTNKSNNYFRYYCYQLTFE